MPAAATNVKMLTLVHTDVDTTSSIVGNKGKGNKGNGKNETESEERKIGKWEKEK